MAKGSHNILQIIIVITSLTIGFSFADTIKNQEQCIKKLQTYFDSNMKLPIDCIRHAIKSYGISDSDEDLLTKYVKDLSQHITQGDVMTPKEFCQDCAKKMTEISGYVETLKLEVGIEEYNVERKTEDACKKELSSVFEGNMQDILKYAVKNFISTDNPFHEDYIGHIIKNCGEDGQIIQNIQRSKYSMTRYSTGNISNN